MPSAAGVMQAMTSLPARVFVVLELLNGALAAGAHRAQRRMPAEVGQIEPQRETDLEQVLTCPRFDMADFLHESSPYVSCGYYLHGHRLLTNVLFEVLLEIFQCALRAVPSRRAPARRK